MNSIRLTRMLKCSFCFVFNLQVNCASFILIFTEHPLCARHGVGSEKNLEEDIIPTPGFSCTLYQPQKSFPNILAQASFHFEFPLPLFLIYWSCFSLIGLLILNYKRRGTRQIKVIVSSENEGRRN